MEAVPEVKKNTERWKDRYKDIHRLVNDVQKYTISESFGDHPVDLFGGENVPALDLSLLPTVIGKYAAVEAEGIGCDPAIVAFTAITVCAAAIDDGTQVQVRRHDPKWRESTRLWTMLVGPPSSKKTPGMKPALTVAYSIEGDWRAEDEKELESYDQELKVYKAAETKYVKDSINGKPYSIPDKPKKPPQRRLILSDTTTEAAARILADNERGVLLVHDEASGFFGSMDAYRQSGTNKDRPFYLQAFNGGRYHVDRVNGGCTVIPNLSMSILGGIQPAMIRKVANKLDDDGLLQRFLPICALRATKGLDKCSDAAVSVNYETVVDRLIAEPIPDTPFQLAVGAHKIREELEEFVEQAGALENVSPKLAAHLAKWPGIFARLLLTFHVINMALQYSGPPQLIPETTAKQVLTLMKMYLLPHAIHFYLNVLRGDINMEHARWLAGLILARGLPRIDLRTITQGFRGLREAKRYEIQTVMQTLEHLDWVRPEKLGDPDPHAWLVNPAVHKCFADHAVRERKRREEALCILKEKFGETG